jgi:formylmethanofuran dehydrogenase subunit E
MAQDGLPDKRMQPVTRLGSPCRVQMEGLMCDLRPYLEESSKRHSHLCPRLVLGVRMALAGALNLGLEIPRSDKNLLVIAETDGCFLDGLEVTAGVSPGHRTLRIEDYGKVAATFVDVRTGAATRLAPRPDVRLRARDYAPGESRHYFAQLTGYQIMPDEELFSMTPVVLSTLVGDLISRAGMRTTCELCGEEIINEREIMVDGMAYCRSCWGQTYYQVTAPAMQVFAGVQWVELPEVCCEPQGFAVAPPANPFTFG